MKALTTLALSALLLAVYLTPVDEQENETFVMFKEPEVIAISWSTKQLRYVLGRDKDGNKIRLTDYRNPEVQHVISKYPECIIWVR